MTDEPNGTMDRQPTQQTITWLLNLRKFDQLDLEPPYQRRSVWSLRERRRFVDTVFRNYPSPAIFLHVTYDEDGNATYHVVDGKQRLTTILDFVDNKFRVAKDFGDSRLDGHNWKDLEAHPRLRKNFWTYQLTVEQIDDVNEPLVREIFERLNRNSRKLEPQEMRHARFDGWLINYLENEAESPLWRDLKVSTRARSKRMADVQILSEFAQVIIVGGISGFDQEGLDQLYADFDDIDSHESFEEDAFSSAFTTSALYLRDMNGENDCVIRVAGSRNHLYTLWSVIALESDLPDAQAAAVSYSKFIDEYDRLKLLESRAPARDGSQDDPRVVKYLRNSVGATTEGPQRAARFEALRDWMIGD